MRRPSRLFWLVVAATLLTGAGQGWQGLQRRQAMALLAAAREAPRHVSYHGTKVTRLSVAPGAMCLVRVAHQAPDRTELRYLGPLAGGLRVVRVAGQVWQSDPLRQQVHHQTAAIEVPLARLAGARVRASAGQPVAGRPTMWLSVSRDSHHQQLWLDRETGLVLRSRIQREDQSVSDSWFTALTVGDVGADADFVPPAGRQIESAEPSTLEACAAHLGLPLGQPRWLPAGFQQTAAQIFRCPCGCGMEAAQLAYSDGLRWLSVFQVAQEQVACLANDECCRQASLCRGCLGCPVSGLNVVALVDRQPAVVVVGDLAETVLAAIASSTPSQPRP